MFPSAIGMLVAISRVKRGHVEIPYPGHFPGWTDLDTIRKLRRLGIQVMASPNNPGAIITDDPEGVRAAISAAWEANKGKRWWQL